MNKSILLNALLSAAAGGIKLIGGLLLIKLAVGKLGADKLVLLGQFNNIFMIASGLAGAGIYTGYVSMSSGVSDGFDKKLFHKSIIHALKTLTIGLIVYIVLWYIYLSDLKFITDIILIFSIFLCAFFPFAEILQAIINTSFSSKILYHIKIYSTLISLLLGSILINYLEYGGYLINTLFGISVTIVSVILIYTQRKKINVEEKINCSKKINFYPYTQIFIFSMIFVPVSKILSRDFIITNEGLANASLWQSYLTVSDSYTVIFSMFLSVFYLKEINKLKSKPILNIFLEYSKRLLVVLFIAFIVVFFIWPYLTLFFMNVDISKNGDYRTFIIAGDLFRFMSLLLTYNFIVRKKFKLGILLEILQSLLYFGLIYLFYSFAAFEGVFISYFICYSLYFFIVFFIVLFKTKSAIVC